MTLITFIVALVLVGVALWAVNQFPFIDPPVKKVIYVVIVVAACIWALSALGLLAGVPNPRIGR
jgi:hypothetical protein